MPMHPAVEEYDLFPVLELLFTDQKDQALDRLAALGFIDQKSRPFWEAELQKQQYNKNISDLVAAAKMMLDPKAALNGKLSSKEPLSILANLLSIMETAKQFGHDYSLDAVKNRTILDCGSGIYYSFSSSVVLFANGYRKAIGYEPFTLQTDFVVSSLFELVRSIFEQPDKFRFSGISARELKTRVASLDFEGLQAKLERLNKREINVVDLGGVILTNHADTIADSSIDAIFSNSVLEHVKDLPSELHWHRRVLADNGLCFHTVDFADHRSYLNNSLSLVEMYYDGVLDEINGLRPSQMETAFLTAGFAGGKLQKLQIPDTQLSPSREMVSPFAGLPRNDLLEWINGYILKKNA